MHLLISYRTACFNCLAVCRTPARGFAVLDEVSGTSPATVSELAIHCAETYKSASSKRQKRHQF